MFERKEFCKIYMSITDNRIIDNMNNRNKQTSIFFCILGFPGRGFWNWENVPVEIRRTAWNWCCVILGWKVHVLWTIGGWNHLANAWGPWLRTCSSHLFTNPEFSYFFWKKKFSSVIKAFNNPFWFLKENPFRTDQNKRQISICANFIEKIQVFVDSGFVKTCDELVIDSMERPCLPEPRTL